jgi:DNA polymerase-3 subunit chi
MTKVSFLFGTADRREAATTWLAGAYRQNQSVVVFQPDSEKLAALDRWLWSHPATGFLPHCAINAPQAEQTPIVLAQSLDSSLHDQCLLNLSDDIPQGFTRFSELIEIISDDEETRLAGRERFRYYRDRGYAIQSVSLNTQD